MKVEVTACDNQSCDETTHDLYGWVVADVTVVGHGPRVEVEVCSTDCLGAGTDDVIQRWYDEEHRRSREQSDQLEAAIISVECPRCHSPAGVQCCALTGKITQQPHAGRRELGREKLLAERETK